MKESRSASKCSLSRISTGLTSPIEVLHCFSVVNYGFCGFVAVQGLVCGHCRNRDRRIGAVGEDFSILFRYSGFVMHECEREGCSLA